jgi:hypothetical protein
VTPWFAASTGFVIAAALWVYSPHAELNFPYAIKKVPCYVQGCMNLPNGPGSLATKTPGQRLRQHKTSGAALPGGAGRSAASGLKFAFTVLSHADGQFVARITISGKHPLGSWRLFFRMPGAQIGSVLGAQWLPSPHLDRATVSAEQPRYGRQDSQNEVSFFVFGSGAVKKPVGCRYDGAACTFTASAGDASSAGYGGAGNAFAAGNSAGSQ